MERPLLSRLVSICLLSTVLFLATVLVPFSASAQLDGPTIKDKAPEATSPVVTTIGANIPEKIDSVYQNIRWQIIGTGTMAFMNAMQTFFGQIAYDAADYLASGGKGRSALYYKKGFQEYLKDVGGSAAGEFIGSMSQASFFQTIGFDLCRPPDPKNLLRIQLSLGQFLPNGTTPAYQRPQARCEFNDIVRNYEEVYQTLSNGDVLKNVDASLNTNANDLGVSFLIFNRAQEFVYRRQETSEKDRKEGNGYQGLRDIVSGRIRTPSDTIREEANQITVKDPKANQEQINTFILNQAWNLGPIRLATYTASVFLNTFASRMLSRIFENGLDMFDPFKQRTLANSGGPDDLLVGSAEDGRQANIDIRTPNLFQDRAYDVISDMQACPENRGTWNCTIDEGFAQALHAESGSGSFTIREALERGYLKKKWRLFPTSSQREEQDPLCYTYGYCSGNLRKLRLMRIIPVGFEFVANDPRNIARCASDQGCLTLGEAIDGFTACNAQGQRDDQHPWCKLIDPDWALTSFPQQCALTGYGDVMLSSALPQRRQECQDIQTCLRRNDAGECVGGYGQCVAERAVYRFGGEECSARFASCRSYTPRNEEQPVAYLRNTLDYAQCSADNVGCLWYATERDPNNSTPDPWIGTVSEGKRIYFDKTIEACEASAEGCTRLLAVKEGEKALNLIANSSFEQISSAGAIQSWAPITGDSRAFVRPNVVQGEAAADGTTGAGFTGGFAGGYRQVVDLRPGHNYVISGFIRRLGETTPTMRLGVRQFSTRENALARTAPLAPEVLRRNYSTAECAISSSPGDFYGATIAVRAEVSAQSATWSRVECSFTADALAVAGEILLQGQSAIVDAIMLEEGSVAGRYLDGVNQSLETVYHKVAPEEYRCTGAATDPAQCANYALTCRQTEAGCEGYTDTNGAFPEVAAQLGNNDACPAVCVGYAEYRKLASSFDLVQSATPEANDSTEVRSVNFIPSTAEQCTQEAVGCEEFTVTDAATDGGESKAYFNSLRFCEKPADDSATYFTWEGSDSAGYQLRTWSLKKRTTEKLGDVPPEGAALTVAAGPRIVVKRSGDLFSQVDPLNCNEANWRTGADGDCRQFYDATGNVFYRYYSQTVLSTNDCRSYRLTIGSADDCTKTGGRYNTEQNACTYQAYAPESGSCTANFAGCRSYAGAEAGNLRTVFTANGSSSTAVQSARVSSESLLVGDQSYRADVAAGRSGDVSMKFPSTGTGLYRVSFRAKSTVPTTVVIRASNSDGSVPRVVGSARFTGDWQQVTVGLFDGAAGAETQLRFTVSVAGSAPAAFFIDEIVVQQLRDLIFVRQETWKTPNACDQNAYGVPEPKAMLGCREYRNRDGATVNARQFSQLCRPQAIGCRAFIDTRNTDQPYRQAFTQNDRGTPFVTEHAPSRYIYVIDDKSRRCDASTASCRAFGKPLFREDRQTIERYETVYLKDDVRKYGEGLCKPSELFCEEFTTGNGAEYFKDPKNHVCEYRDQVQVDSTPGVPDGTYSGWFIAGKSVPCYPNALATGQLFQVLRTGDSTPAPGYEGWAAMCPEEQNECTEFRDTNDRTASNVNGRAYYFIKNELIDLSSCNGTVDPSRGCVLLRNMSKSTLTYSTEATLKAYQAANLQGVPAVDCQSNPTQVGCAGIQSGRCTGTRVTERYRVGNLDRDDGSEELVIDSRLSTAYVGSSCSQDSDCAREAATSTSGQTLVYFTADAGRVEAREIASAVNGITCERPSLNDANEVVKIKVDRDCSQWLGCATGETVYDPSTNRYRDICTKYALCDKGSEQGSNSATYCSNYVNRSSSSTEPVLTAGAYFDAKQYTSRPLATGKRDYSGYTIPNAFQVVDLQSRALADDLPMLNVSAAQSQQRLVVTVKMPPIRPETALVGGRRNYLHLVPPISPNQAEVIPANSPLYQNIDPSINICRHRGTGMIGYFSQQDALRAGQEVNCYLSFRGSQEANAFVALNNRLKANTGEQDLVLDQSYPRGLCRSYPEAEAPFSSDVVTKWNLSTNPISPLEVKAGYQEVNTCAYGEDCSCGYKRVSYPGLPRPRFFAVDSQAVPPGICVGGPRSGQACLPSDVYSITSSTSTSAQAAQAANNAQSCGAPNGGGQCVAFGKAEIVRGVMGSCLEYDTTHGRGKLGDQTFPCLVWNPSPIVGGENDPYHYVQTAGYFPPQNAGQYYCSSKSRPPTKYNLSSADFSGLPGGIRYISYHDALVSDGNGVAGMIISNILGVGLGSFGPMFTSAVYGRFSDKSDVPGAYFNGQHPNGSNAATQCEDADDDQDDDGLYEFDGYGLRIVATARGEEASYTETFYRMSPNAFAGWLNRIEPSQTTSNQRRDAMMDQNISYIQVKPFRNPNGNGRLACGYQEDWVDGVQVSDYDSLDETGPADRKWHQEFLAEEDLSMFLTRGTEQILTTTPAGATGNTPVGPLRMPCESLSTSPQPPDTTGECYFKTWEIGYRAANKKSFVAFLPNGREISSRGREAGGFTGLFDPVYEQCDSEKPYYAIRAVFQTEAAVQSGEVTVNNVRGPWRMVGFWVSTCGGRGQTDNRFIYMNVTIQNADICRDLVEVRSSKTNQDAAFTDRIWKDSKYAVPILGIQYGQSFAPFSSALNTGPAGKDPLYQTGGKVTGSSAINPPTFLASGYYSYYGPATGGVPRDRYAYLSNLFARIYRVYHFSEQQIKRDDKICMNGPNIGRKCVPDAPPGEPVPIRGESVDCRPIAGSALCDVNEPPPDDTKVCNALSGINRGLSCTRKPESCHAYALDPRPTVTRPTPLLTNCVENPVETERRARPFRCAAGAIRLRSDFVALNDIYTVFNPARNPPPYSSLGTIYCSQAAENSSECPLEVIGRCVPTPGAGDISTGTGTCEVRWGQNVTDIRTSISCSNNNDCSFNGNNFWRAPPQASFGPYSITITSAPDNNRNIAYPGPSHVVEHDGHRGGLIALQGNNGQRYSGAGLMSNDSYLDPGTFTRNWQSCGNNCNSGQIAARLGALVSRPVSSTVSSYPGAIPAGPETPIIKNMLNCQSAADVAFLRAEEDCRLYSPQIDCNSITDPDVATQDQLRRECSSSHPPITVGYKNMYTVGGCESLSGLIGAQSTALQLGTCVGSAANPGSICLRARGETPPAAPYSYWLSSQTCRAAAADPAGYSCEPVSNPPPSEPSPGSAQRSDLALVPVPVCELPSRRGAGVSALDYYTNLVPPIPLSGRNYNNDNNKCTAEVGYQVDPTLCPNPESEFCGLITYDMRANRPDTRSIDLRESQVPLPTDVTLGYYTPSFLGFNELPASKYEYIDYYTPRPPRIAAPNTRCPNGTNCGVQDIDKFSFNGITQGIVNVVGGQYRSVIKFYGWAAHEQMSLRRLSVDWGDGTVQDFSDVKLKNHKPFCSVNKECYSPTDGFTGLTCESDNECPLQAQACRAMGSCKDKKNLVCAQDSDCRRDRTNDTCDVRAFFGNSAGACEASPFEYAHVYACPASAASTLPNCRGQNLFQSNGQSSIDFNGVRDLVAPAAGRPGTCYFGTVDGLVLEGHGRSTCTTAGAAGAAECRAYYGRIFGIADTTSPSAQFPADIFNSITCGPPSVEGASPVAGSGGIPIPITQSRCSGDASRYCSVNNDCAAGDTCIAAGLAPPNGCWDDQNNACRFTPRVFLQDNWGWCTGECRSERVGGTLQDNQTSAIRHTYGGCYTPVPEGADAKEAARTNVPDETGVNPLIGLERSGYPKLECAIDRPIGALPSTLADPRRNYRPWIVFPGSIQIRPR